MTDSDHPAGKWLGNFGEFRFPANNPLKPDLSKNRWHGWWNYSKLGSGPFHILSWSGRDTSLYNQEIGDIHPFFSSRRSISSGSFPWWNQLRQKNTNIVKLIYLAKYTPPFLFRHDEIAHYGTLFFLSQPRLPEAKQSGTSLICIVLEVDQDPGKTPESFTRLLWVGLGLYYRVGVAVLYVSSLVELERCHTISLQMLF